MLLHSSWSVTKTIIFLTGCTLISGIPDTVVRADVYRFAVAPNSDKSDLPSYLISSEKIVLEKHRSPYLVKKDVLIEEDGELQIEPGVTLLFAPTTGITVKGVLTAKGVGNDRIVFTSASAFNKEDTDSSPLQEIWQQIRLTDGPNPLTGRLQIYHNGEWRSVCTNSRNWTKIDLDTVCRHMGFQEGKFWKWVDRENGIRRPHLLLEKPSCKGNLTSIFQCNWPSRQLGSGVCDYHPDIGIECTPKYEPSKVVNHWRGINFINSQYERTLVHQNTLYVRKSHSKLLNVDIRYAGTGRDYITQSAVHVEGVPPVMQSCSIGFSAYNGINITDPQTPVTLLNTTISNNRGYGVYVNTTDGGVLLDSCTIMQNGADGVKFLHHEESEHIVDRNANILDFCTIPIISSQTFPIVVNFEQNAFSVQQKECRQTFYSRPGQVMTVFVKHLSKVGEGNAKIEIHDGIGPSDNLLATINIVNNTRPQSVTTTSSNLFIRAVSDARIDSFATIRIMSSNQKWYDLGVIDSSVADNNGRGIATENIHSQLYLKRTSVSNNNHIAGVHVLYGASYVNISESRISFNVGDGVNITNAGGVCNVSDSFISSNKGFGVALWSNLTTRRETFMRQYWPEDIDYLSVPFNQETVIAYNEIFRNLETGVMVGNFCGNSFVNISGNWFNTSVGNGIEILSCWKNEKNRTKNLMTIQIGNNYFIENQKLGIKLSPLVNADAVIEYNYFTKHTYGAILIRNGANEYLSRLYAKANVRHNEFYDNSGIYVVNMGLSPYSETQKLLFSWNFVKNNRIQEPFQREIGTSKLIPRSKVAAPVVISSENTLVFRNIIQNHESKYEIGSHLEDQSLAINCTYNWLGYGSEDLFIYRLFHRRDRYNLARISYIPYLLHSSNPASTLIRDFPTYVPEFVKPNSKIIGGEVDGKETLRTGEFIVERDINVRPGGILTLEAGITLRFPPGIGMMVAGELQTKGNGVKEIKFVLHEERNEIPTVDYENETIVESSPVIDNTPVRLVGGRTPLEGRLQVNINGKWGTICNHGWTIKSAALVCNQLGYVLNPNDWLLEHYDIPEAGIGDPIILSNVKCTDEDLDITKCKAERENEFENSCNHDHDVGLRCHEPKWAGVRFSVLAKRTNLQFLSIEHAGLLDYATNVLKPALQIDLNRHILENIRLSNNIDDGLGIIYSDLYSLGTSNIVKNCEFVNNQGSGISVKQFGLKLTGSLLTNNKVAGIRHDPVITSKQQQEIAGWFRLSATDYNPAVTYLPILLPRFDEHSVIDFSNEGETKYIITERLLNSQIVNKTYSIKTKPHLVLGIQVLNPIHNESTEQILIYDSRSISLQSRVWDLRKDLMAFPTLSRTHNILLKYESGPNAIGNVILVITCTPARQESLHLRAVNFDSFPTLLVTNTRIKQNGYGIWSSYYNSYLSEFGDHHLRKSNETLCLIDCDISFNNYEVILVHSQNSILDQTNISETTIIINNTAITDNGRGIRQLSRHQRNSNNLFHWYLYRNTIERNAAGSFEVILPSVWSYNENYTHSVTAENNTWKYNKNFAFIVDGHYAQFNLSHNVFQYNKCKNGLISIRGMEKSMRITRNTISDNEGIYMIEFKANSQSEIRGELRAIFFENSVKRNNPPSPQVATSLIVFDGIQRVRIKRNLMSENGLAYALVAGVKTAQIDSTLDISENWWGTIDYAKIKRQIFDFDDWNDHALANFRPYLIEDDFDSSVSVSFEPQTKLDVENLAGRLLTSLVLRKRSQPYIFRSDLTVMPEVTLTIEPGVVMEFGPRVGLLVLGTLIAKGRKDDKIIMRPISETHYNMEKFKKTVNPQNMVRLCIDNNCTETGRKAMNEGFLEYWNTTTLQWVPLCDETFVEQNARVVCRQLGLGSLNAWVSRGRRYEFLPNALTRIWSWPESWQCSGEEETLDDCPERLHEQMYRERRVCHWNDEFVFIRCSDPDSVEENLNYWGGIRLANSQFEKNGYRGRIHDHITHDNSPHRESVLEYVQIIGAGMLHYQRSPALLGVFKSPQVTHVNISQCASHGINLISPEHDVKLLFNRVERCLDTAISIASLTGEGRENSESSFSPAQKVDIPYNAFGMLDMCDPLKEIILQEKILVYYKYTNNPVSCIKIFHSSYRIKQFGLRFLQLNLFNETDVISLYDGSIYNVSSPIVATISNKWHNKKHFLTTNGTSLSIKMMVSGAAHNYGFIAEIVTLPISAITFNRDVLHNVSFSTFTNNWAGAVYYVSAGEVNPRFTMEWNQITNNCLKLWGNFTTCDSAVLMDLQNTQNLHFKNNLVRQNIGGLWIKADSEGSATSLKAIINHNLFADNMVKSPLKIEGRRSSPYQDVVVYRNFFAKNYIPYENVIILDQILSNFTLNYIQNNLGAHILEVSGFERARLPVFQSTSHNGFYWNLAVERDSRSTVIAGTAGQHYVDNVFSNPDNDYELITVNSSFIDMWKTPIDARYNYWGYNETWAVGGRIHDNSDDLRLLQVNYQPYHMTNESLLDEKCPPAWNLVADTCYIYIGAPMSFHEAREFCISVNASMPYITTSYFMLFKFMKQQEHYYSLRDPVWVQNINKVSKCTSFVYQNTEEDDCNHPHPFICEMDPKVSINVLSWTSDILTVAVFSSVLLAFLLLAVVAALWYSKSQHRHTERLQRRNSIRQSLNSLRSLSSSQTGFNELGYKRRALSSQATNLSLSRTSDYKKMNGSLDSMDKSQFNSSLEEDTQSYDIYEAHNPNAAATPSDQSKSNYIDLSYQNHGYRNNSSFTSRDDDGWQSTSYVNSSTLPLSDTLRMGESNGTISSKQDYQRENEYQEYYERPRSSNTILETNFDLKPSLQNVLPPTRSKSETLLETNFDYMLPTQDVKYSAPISDVFSNATVAKSKSQPLETAM